MLERRLVVNGAILDAEPPEFRDCSRATWLVRISKCGARIIERRCWSSAPPKIGISWC